MDTPPTLSDDVGQCRIISDTVGHCRTLSDTVGQFAPPTVLAVFRFAVLDPAGGLPFCRFEPWGTLAILPFCRFGKPAQNGGAGRLDYSPNNPWALTLPSLNLSLGNFPKASKRIPKTPRESMVCKWLAVLHMLAMAAAHARKQGRLCKWVNCVAMVCSAHTWLGLQGGCCLRTQPNATLECNTRTTHVHTLALQALQS